MIRVVLFLTLFTYLHAGPINVCDQDSAKRDCSGCYCPDNLFSLNNSAKVLEFNTNLETEKNINNQYWTELISNKKTNYFNRIEQNLSLSILNSQDDFSKNCNDLIAVEDFRCNPANLNRILVGLGCQITQSCSGTRCIKDCLDLQSTERFNAAIQIQNKEKNIKSMESGECLTFEEKQMAKSFFSKEELTYFKKEISTLSFDEFKNLVKDPVKRKEFKEKISENPLLGIYFTSMIDLLADDVPLLPEADCDPNPSQNNEAFPCHLKVKGNVKVKGRREEKGPQEKIFDNAKAFLTSYVSVSEGFTSIPQTKTSWDVLNFLKEKSNALIQDTKSLQMLSCEYFSENLKNIACANEPLDDPSKRNVLKDIHKCEEDPGTEICNFLSSKKCLLKKSNDEYYNSDIINLSKFDRKNDLINHLCDGFKEKKQKAFAQYKKEKSISNCDQACEEKFLSDNFDKIKNETIHENAKKDGNFKAAADFLSSDAVKGVNKVDVEKSSNNFKNRKMKSFNEPFPKEAPSSSSASSSTSEKKLAPSQEYTPITAPDMSKVNANYKYYQDYSERIKKLNEKANETTKKIEAIKDQAVKKYGPDEKSWPPQAQNENSELQKLRDEAAALRKEIDDLKKEAKKKFPNEAENKMNENKSTSSDSKNESGKTDTKSVTNNNSTSASSGSTSSVAPSNVNQAAVVDNTFVRPPIAVDNSPNSNTLESKLMNNVLLSIQEKKLNGTIVDRLKVITLNAKEYEKINDKNIKDFIKPEGNQGTLEVVNKQDMNQKMLIRYWKNSDGIYQFEKLDQIKAKQVERKFRFDSMKDIIQKLTPVN